MASTEEVTGIIEVTEVTKIIEATDAEKPVEVIESTEGTKVMEVTEQPTEAAKDAEVPEGTEVLKAAEMMEVTEVTEAHEVSQVIEASEITEVTEVTKASQVKEVTEAEEVTEAAKDTEPAQAPEAPEVTEITEASEVTEVTDAIEVKESQDAKNKQPTGSSKRKRKHSIKRNIVLDDNSNCSDSGKSPKSEKTYGKKAKAEKTKSEKEVSEVIPKKETEQISEILLPDEVKSECLVEDEFLLAQVEEKKCKNNKDSNSASGGECSSSKTQCQNCKYCSEHVDTKEEAEDPKEKAGSNKKKYACEICAKEGSTRVYNSIERHKHHMATVHEIYSEEIKRFECQDCPESVWFPTKSKYAYHLGTKHPGVMRFVCEVCTEAFILKANYKNHMKTHNLVVRKKFSCDVCNGTFVNKAGYEAHKKRFPGPHIKQSCTHCGFSFSKEKHMKNHRCKTLLLEEAAARTNKLQNVSITGGSNVIRIPSDLEGRHAAEGNQKTSEAPAEGNSSSKKGDGSDPNKRVVLHRIIPRRNQDQTVYRPVQMQSHSVPESLVVQELREIDLENGTFITATSNDSEQQYIVRDINGHFLQGNQILQLDINDVQQGEENQVYLADWNVVAPYVIREKSP